MEVKVCSKCNLEKSISEFQKASTGKYGVRGDCKLCNRQKNKKWYSKNKENKASYQKEWILNNEEKRRQYISHYCLENKIHRNKVSKAHYLNNKSYYLSKWVKRNAIKLQAIPKWANLDSITKIYKQRDLLTEETGIMHHVDHIIPLRGKTVCGLHVENNLRVIPAKENLSKGNKLEYDEIYGITNLRDINYMEKSGRLKLTSAELHLILHKEEIPVRIQEQWGFSSFEELKEVISSNQYEVVNSL